MAERNGTIFSFGDAVGYGGAKPARGNPVAPVVGFAPTSDDGGYQLLLGDGRIASFGDATVAGPVPSVGFSLAGEVIGIDPGHNGANGSYPGLIDRLIWNGREYETCDTTGTETNARYSEAAFNFDVASRLAALLRSYGATVVLTRTSNRGVGPCVTTRAAIIDASDADAAVDIHGDGGPAWGRGVAVLEPVADGPNRKVIGSSRTLALDVVRQFRSTAGEPYSNYDGVAGLQPRGDLAGLNLTTVPKVLIECANMRNPGDAARVTSRAWRQKAAVGLVRGLSLFLTGYP